MRMGGLCRHCKINQGQWRRGLCMPCGETPEILTLYPKSPTTRRGSVNKGMVLPARHATKALPGTEEKILVMQARAEMGEAIFHSDDAGCQPIHCDREM